MSDDALSTVEFFVMAYREALSYKYFEDGMKTSDRTMEFRMRFKDRSWLPTPPVLVRPWVLQVSRALGVLLCPRLIVVACQRGRSLPLFKCVVVVSC